MTVPKIGIVVSSIRQNRFADKPLQWFLDIAAARTDLEVEVVDLRNYPMPLFEGESPVRAPVTEPTAKRLAQKMATLDGFVFITAEYQHSIPGALKNALDYLYTEMHRKPGAFVGYGGVGAARAIEQLRLIIVELHMTPIRDAVHISLEPYLGVAMQGKSLNDYEYLVASAKTMLDQLVWWARILKAGRDQSGRNAGIAA